MELFLLLTCGDALIVKDPGFFVAFSASMASNCYRCFQQDFRSREDSERMDFSGMRFFPGASTEMRH